MKKIALLTLVLLLIPNASGSIPVRVEIEKTHMGGAVTGGDETPYRVLIVENDTLPVLYPEPLNGRLELDVEDIIGNYSIQAVVLVYFEITDPKENGFRKSALEFPLLNETLKIGKNTFEFGEIEHFSGVSVFLDNGTRVPTSSYYYFEEMRKNSTITGRIALYFEQSNHTEDWEMEIIYSGYFEYNADNRLQRNYETTTETTPFLFIGGFIAIIIPRKLSHILRD